MVFYSFSPILVYTQVSFVLQAYVLSVAAIVLVRLVLAVKSREVGATASLLSFLCLLGGVINDILYNHRMIQTSYVVPYVFTLYLVTQSLLQGYFHKASLDRLTLMSEQLAKQVEEKTRSLDQVNRDLSRILVKPNS